MSEQTLATWLRQDALEHASEEDKPFFARMDDKDIIERVLICTLCEQRVLAYEMAITANTIEELENLLAAFGDAEHLNRCVPIMMQLGPEGLAQLQIHREEQEEAQFQDDVKHFQSVFEEHKQELLDIMEHRPDEE